MIPSETGFQRLNSLYSFGTRTIPCPDNMAALIERLLPRIYENGLLSFARENTELKKMLAESLLKNRVLEFVCENGLTP